MSEGDDAKPEDETETDATEEERGEGEGEDGEDEASGVIKELKAKLAANLKLVIIIVASVVVLGGGSAGIYFSGILHVEKPHEVSVKLPDPPVYHDVPRITVDLKPSRRHARPFIRLTVQAELQGESAKAAFIANEAKIMDAIQSDLRNTTVEDLEGVEGTERLRENFTIIINRIIAPEIAITVLYKDILIR